VETRSHSTLFLLLPSPARQKMLRDENLSARETVRRIPATSVTLFREASVEDACDMEASSQKPPIDRMVHGNFAYRHPLPHVPRCLGHCANGLIREAVGKGTGRRWKYFLPSFSFDPSSSAASFISPAAAFPSPAFEPRCYILLSGTPAPSGTPCILRICPLRSSLPAPSGYSQPVYVHPSILPSDRIRCRRDTDTRTCTAGNVRVTPSPVALFLEVAECGRS